MSSYAFSQFLQTDLLVDYAAKDYAAKIDYLNLYNQKNVPYNGSWTVLLGGTATGADNLGFPANSGNRPENAVSVRNETQSISYLDPALDFGLPSNKPRPLSRMEQELERLVQIFSAQANKIFELAMAELPHIRYGDQEDLSEEEKSLAEKIDLLGEPAIFGISAALQHSGDDQLSFEFLTNALAISDDLQTSDLRAQIISKGAQSADPAVRLLAVEALGRIGGPFAGFILRDIVDKEINKSVKEAACNLLA